jgi:hypothetical protein
MFASKSAASSAALFLLDYPGRQLERLLLYQRIAGINLSSRAAAAVGGGWDLDSSF